MLNYSLINQILKNVLKLQKIKIIRQPNSIEHSQ